MLDRPADSTVDVSFNITMERLPCRFASVDLFDETGTKRLNITLSIRKTRLSALDGSHLPDAAPEVWTDEPGEVAALAGAFGRRHGRRRGWQVASARLDPQPLPALRPVVRARAAAHRRVGQGPADGFVRAV